MGYNILFWPDINYEPGHWRPVLSMAQKVKNAYMGCAIRFLCTPECKSIVESVKMPSGTRLFGSNEIFTILDKFFPVGYSTLVNEKPEEARLRIDHCLKIAQGEFDGLLKTFKPHLLIAGYFVSMEALLIQYRYNKIRNSSDPEMKIIIITTFLRHPSEDPAITSIRFLAHHAQEQSSKLMRAAVGDTTKSSAFNGSFSSIQDFISPLETVTELITCPQELDHDHFKHRKNTYYVESCILDTNPNYIPGKNLNLIYATAGSRVRDYIESAKAMFQTLQNIIRISAASHRTLELAVGYTLREKFSSTSKITIKEWTDQADSLKRARSAVVHGGLATIKECIYFGIPPIVIPLGKDQMDNALRVVNKEVGTMIMLDTLTPVELYNTILNAEKNSDINNNLSNMQRKFIAMERSQPSIWYIKRALGIL